MAAVPRVASADPSIRAVFGSDADPMDALDARARELFPDQDAIVWEGDAATFRFTYVSAAAERVLGHPVARWTGEPTFWADQVVSPLDRDEAIGYCALATFRGVDHTFEYRALTTDGREVWLRDFVRVVHSLPKMLRGIMFDVTAEKQAAQAAPTPERAPTRAELDAAG